MYRLSEKEPPKNEDTVICCLCGKPITEWPEDERFRKYLRKWRAHERCYHLVIKRLDAEAR